MKKIRIEWLAATLVVLIMGGVLAWIFASSAEENSRKMEIELSPGIAAAGEAIIRPEEKQPEENAVLIDADNVSAVIAALERPEIYHMTADVTVYYGDASRVTHAERWEMAHSVCVKRWSDEENAEEYMIIDGKAITCWRAGGQVYTGELGSETGDTASGIPTYEEVAYPANRQIDSAYYCEYNDESCIYAEVFDNELDYTIQYYISVESGILIYSDTYKSGELIYSMSVTGFDVDMSGSFAIEPPD